jgi:hemoglobin
VLQDETIGFIFSDVAKIDMEEHMPKMYAFWENMLFQKVSYKGNPISVHINLHKKQALEEVHFKRWLQLFNECIDGLFAGPKAELAKTRALSIAAIMQIKISKFNR